MASRAVDSQQTFVAVPTMISVSILRARKQRIEIGGALHERAEAVFAHDRVPGLNVKFGVKRMAEIAGRKCAPHARAPFCIGEIVKVNGPRFVAPGRW